MLKLSVLLFAVLLVKIRCQCLAGWTLYMHANKCIRPFAERMSFFSAQQFCEAQGSGNGGSLVSIHNSFQNAQLGSLAGVMAESCPFWIGLYDFDSSNAYQWTDDSEMDYTNWADDFPTGVREETGAFMNVLLRNRWEETADLSSLYCFFCEQNANQVVRTTAQPTTPHRTGHCKEGWIQLGGSCYQVIRTIKNFADGLAYCEAEGAHLALLKTREKLEFAKGFVKYPWAWVGLTKSEDGIWRWSDGEPLNEELWCHFAYGDNDEPNNCCGPGPYTCANLLDETQYPDEPQEACVGDIGCGENIMSICEYEA